MVIKKIYSSQLFQEIGNQLVADASRLGFPPGYFPTYIDLPATRFWQHDIIRQEGETLQVDYLDENKNRLVILND